MNIQNLFLTITLSGMIIISNLQKKKLRQREVKYTCPRSQC